MPLAFLQLPRGCVEIREHVAGLKMERHGGSRRSRSSGDVRARACGQISRVNLCKGCGHKDARARKGGEWACAWTTLKTRAPVTGNTILAPI
jgi:hypothetical protein